MAECLCMRLVQNLHDSVVELANGECLDKQLFSLWCRLGEKVQKFVNLAVGNWITCAQCKRVCGVCGNSLQAVEHEFLKIRDLLTFREKPYGKQGLLTLSKETFERRCGNPCGRPTKVGRSG